MKTLFPIILLLSLILAFQHIEVGQENKVVSTTADHTSNSYPDPVAADGGVQGLLTHPITSSPFFSVFSTGSDVSMYPALRYSTPSDGLLMPEGSDAFTLNASGVAKSNTPIISEYTTNAGPNESIIITGDKLTVTDGSDAELELWDGMSFYSSTPSNSQNGMAIENYAAIYSMPASVDKRFLVGWPKNSNGYGSPIKINGTEVWWAEDKIVAGSKAYVYGKNLSYRGGTSTSYVYLKNSSTGKISEAKVTKVNPYCVEYNVPSVDNGTYELWVHNGSGGQYNWSKNPTRIKVWSGMVWRGKNVKPTLVLNDETAASANTKAINKAAAELNGLWGTITLPSGIIYINDRLDARTKVRLKGNGGNAIKNTLNTEIRLASTFPASGRLFENNNRTEFQIEDLYINTNNNFHTSSDLMYFRFGSDLTLKNVRVYAKKNNTESGSVDNIPLMDAHMKEYLRIEDCYFIAGQLNLLKARKVKIVNTDFKGVNASVTAIYSWGGSEISMTESRLSDVNPANVQETSRGRWFTTTGVWGANKNIYIADNVGTDLGVHPDFGDKNQGETFMCEGNDSKMSSYATSATAHTVTFASPRPTITTPEYDLYYLFVTEGKGKGQVREIDVPASGRSGNSFTMKQDWGVIPDHTSRIEMIAGTHNMVIYNNTISQKRYIVSAPYSIASTASQPYGGCSNWITANNTFSGFHIALFNFPTQHLSGRQDPNFWMEWIDNKLIGNKIVYSVHLVKTFPHKGPKILGDLVRGNTIVSSTFQDYGGEGPFSNEGYDSPVMEYSVVENNIMRAQMKNLASPGFPIISTRLVHKQVFHNNTDPPKK